MANNVIAIVWVLFWVAFGVDSIGKVGYCEPYHWSFPMVLGWLVLTSMWIGYCVADARKGK